MRLLRIAALLDLDLAVGLRLQDGTKADSEGAKSVGGAAGKERAPSTSRDGRKSRKGADGDENGRKGSHDLRVLVGDELEWGALVVDVREELGDDGAFSASSWLLVVPAASVPEYAAF